MNEHKKPIPKPQKSPTPVRDEPALDLALTFEQERDLLASQVESSRLYE